MGRTLGRTITPWGRECKSQMILKDISLQELADKTGLSRNYVSAIINSRVAVPEETIAKISTALDIKTKQMVG